jgi:hypothetical protein
MNKETEEWDKYLSVECLIASNSCQLQWLFITYTLKKSTHRIRPCYSCGGYSQVSDHSNVAREQVFLQVLYFH